MAQLGGDFDDISELWQSVFVTPGLSTLHYWYWIGSDDYCGYDFFRIKVDGTTLETKELCDPNNTYGWVEGTLDLSTFTGLTVSLMFEVTTDSSLNSNFYLDDVSFSAP